VTIVAFAFSSYPYSFCRGLCVAVALALGLPFLRALDATQTVRIGSVTMDFILIHPGSFVMGSDENVGAGDESPQHKVTLTKPFYLGKYEVTQEQWAAVMNNDPSRCKGKTLPVDSVTWNDCQRFLAKVTAMTGRVFSLPSEGQWEFACRAGTRTSWSCGDDEAALGDYAWLGINSAGVTHPVGTKAPNSWGLYDMHGNVGEWCADYYDKHGYSPDDVTDPTPHPSSAGHSPNWRGGAWGDPPDYLRSAYRNVNGPDNRHPGIGFRCAMQVSETP
jgi:formylglycine-generating enzyme required for sulfatase activity